ncbi:Uncharacterised protein [Segatella copri]|nr:Uncharacterised protein [Segatella copri]
MFFFITGYKGTIIHRQYKINLNIFSMFCYLRRLHYLCIRKIK